MAGANPIISIITLNIEDINTPVIRQSMVDWSKKQQQQNPTLCCLQKTCFPF